MEYIKPYPTSAVINLTDECNFRCPYCFTEHHPKRSTFEIVDQTCAFLLANHKQNSRFPTITFFGGEPMLEYASIIKPIVEKYTNSIEWGITTNGSLLTEDVLDFFRLHNFSILLSIDGIAEVQNKQRPYKDGRPSFEKVCKNIPYLLMLFPDTMFRSTVTKYSIPFMNKNYDFAEHMGFKSIAYVVNENEEYDVKDFEELEHQYNMLALKMLRGHNTIVNDFSKAKMWSTPHDFSINRCGFGTTSIGVDVDGDITPCQELNTLKSIVIGNVFSGIDEKRHKEFLIQNFNVQKDTFIPNAGQLTPEEISFIRNALCPKHQYLGNMTLSDGRRYQMLALLHSYKRLRLLIEDSNNPIFRRIKL